MSRTANPVRGESEIKIDGQPYVLRPSFEALVAAEAEIGSLFALIERASEGNLSIAEMTALVWNCLPHSHRPEREVVGRALVEMGLVEAAKPVRAILAEVLKGSQ